MIIFAQQQLDKADRRYSAQTLALSIAVHEKEQNSRQQLGQLKESEMPRLVPVILVVEDDFLLRIDAADTIRNAGFEVIQAGNADEAIAVLEARPNIHVVFTDVQMPGSMDGLKLARFVRNRWPPIKIIAPSGQVKVSEADLPEGSIFLPKPYRSNEVVSTLRELTRAA